MKYLRVLCIVFVFGCFRSYPSTSLRMSGGAVRAAHGEQAVGASNPFERLKKISIDLTPKELDLKVLNQINQNINIKKISYQADIKLSPEEWNYITSYKTIDLTGIKKILKLLQRKNKFESVDLIFNNHEVTFKLKGKWTFSKLICQTNIQDKVRFGSWYLISNQEAFDKEKHKHSLIKILKELKNNGYFNAKIKDYISYDNKNKEVIVTLKVEDDDRFVIENIEIKISKFLEKEVLDNIKSILNSELKSSYFSKEQIETQLEIVKDYLLTQGYLNPIIEIIPKTNANKKTVNLEIDIKLSQEKKFIFIGNKFFQSKELLKDYVFENSVGAYVAPALLAEDLTELYKKKGFKSVVITLKETKSKIIFDIEEGGRAIVKDVQINGNSFLSKDIIKYIFSSIYNSSYDEEIIEELMEKLILEYMKNGFWDIKIIGHELVNGTLKINLIQGVQKFLSKIELDSFQEILKEPIFAKYNNLKSPIPFDYNILTEQRNFILEYLRKVGFLYAKVAPDITGPILKWKIDTQIGKVSFGKTVIEGCSKFNSEILLRELKYKEGEVFDNAKIQESVKRLKNLEIFDSISLTPSETDTGAERTMVLRVVEDSPFEVRARLGYQQVSKSFTHQTGSTYRFGASFLWKNPIEIGDKLKADVDLTWYTQDVCLGYELPWIFNMPIKTVIKGYHLAYEQPLYTWSKQKLYHSVSNGLSTLFHYEFSPRIQTNLTCGVEWQKLSGLARQYADVVEFSPALIDKRILYFYLEPTFSMDYVDNPINPTSGGCTQFGAKAKITPQVGGASFVKLTFEQSLFFPIYQSVIGAFRFKVGHIFNEKFDKLLPTDRFFLGGSQSLRGYEPDMVPPLNSFVCDGNRYWIPVGGKTALQVNAEVRFPVYKNLSGVVFSDMGVLSRAPFSDINAQSINGASGFGLRYGTPFGPIRFDIGWKWHKRIPEDRAYTWYLTLGHAF